jgi:anti-sigma factor RsiW
MRVHLNEQAIDSYLDGELRESELQSLLEHLEHCDDCQTLVRDRRLLFETIRSARPRLRAPASLREKVSAILDTGNQPSSPQRVGLRSRVWAHAGWPASTVLRYAVMLFLLVGVGTLWFLLRREARAASFVAMAVETHQLRLHDRLPIQFKTASAREVTAWFDSKLPFRFRLPTYQEDSGDRSKYEMIGGSVASFRGKSTAYIAYRMRNELISLVVTSADQAVASGGDSIVAKSLVFHSTKKGDLEVVTWSVHNLTYALVSDVTLPKRQSCVVCHADPNDHKWLQSAFTHQQGWQKRQRSLPRFSGGKSSL